MERSLVIGPSGSGKSTGAREQGSALGINVIHHDVVFWNPGWVETPRPQFREAAQEIDNFIAEVKGAK
jgi:adenylate kinase family enzyme